MSNWKQTATELLQAITPEFRDAPIYLVSADELASFDSRFDSICPASNGWTGVLCDHLCSEFLRSVGRWDGAGFATVIRANRSPLECVSTVLHESSHYLDWHGQESFQAVRCEHVKTPLPDLHQKIAAANTPAAMEFPRWHLHEQRFIRAACHVAHRANQFIAAIRPKHLAFATDYYGQPFSEQAFLDALGNELDRQEPINEILKTEPPIKFQERHKQAIH